MSCEPVGSFVSWTDPIADVIKSTAYWFSDSFRVIELVWLPRDRMIWLMELKVSYEHQIFVGLLFIVNENHVQVDCKSFVT